MDAQAAALASLTSAMGNTIASMREAASYAERLMEEYVQQNAMLDEATGGAASGPRTLSCARPGEFRAYFNVSAPPPPPAANASGAAAAAQNATAAGGRRRLQQAPGGGAARALVDGALIEWEGYRLSTWVHEHNWAADVSLAPERPRHIGAAGANRLVGGLFLHTTRRPPPAPCARGSFAALLGFECQRAAAAAGVTLVRNATAAAALAAWLRARGTGVAPYGVDPAFLRSSSLYRPELIGREELYYNTSDRFEVSPETGTPFGFFHRQLAGYDDGFPVLLPNRLGAARAGAALQYLLDGNYLDR